MKTKIEKLRQTLQEDAEREASRARERARKRQAKGAELSRLIRSADTRMKILAGSYALDAARKSEEFRETMMRALDRVWLWRDDDRELFGLPLLSDEEKSRRDLSPGKAGRNKITSDDETPSDADASEMPPPRALASREIEAA